MRGFKDKVVLVTGAGRGIGKRLAIGFAAEGARVALVSRTKAELDLVHLEIEHAGGASLRSRADIRDFGQISAAVDRIRETFGEVEILINSAGVLAPVGPLAECEPGAMSEALDTNVLGLLHVCRAVLPGMLAKRSGKIIAVVGQGAFTRLPNFALDNATQVAAARLIESMAEEVRLHNVQVNCLCAGRTYTHMTDLILEAGPQRAGEEVYKEALEVRIGGGTSPEKQLKLAKFLASERSNHISGKLVHVNDDWKKMEHNNMRPELYTLRRAQVL